TNWLIKNSPNHYKFNDRSCSKNKPTNFPGLPGSAILTQVGLEGATVTGFLKSLNYSFLDLADTFLGKIVFLPDLLDRYALLALEAEVCVNDFCFAWAE